jgi:hypothetical protein
MRLRELTWCFTAIWSLSAACSGDGATAPLDACQTAIAVTVTPVGGLGARFDWTPRCGLYGINVTAPPGAGTTANMWTLVSETQLIAPGVHYGDAPAGTRTETPAHPVTAGTSYQVVFTGQAGHPAVATISWVP